MPVELPNFFSCIGIHLFCREIPCRHRDYNIIKELGVLIFLCIMTWDPFFMLVCSFKTCTCTVCATISAVSHNTYLLTHVVSDKWCSSLLSEETLNPEAVKEMHDRERDPLQHFRVGISMQAYRLAAWDMTSTYLVLTLAPYEAGEKGLHQVWQGWPLRGWMHCDHGDFHIKLIVVLVCVRRTEW